MTASVRSSAKLVDSSALVTSSRNQGGANRVSAKGLGRRQRVVPRACAAQISSRCWARRRDQALMQLAGEQGVALRIADQSSDVRPDGGVGENFGGDMDSTAQIIERAAGAAGGPVSAGRLAGIRCDRPG